MDVQRVRVSEGGRIAIPANVRHRIGVRRGATLLLIEDRGLVFLTKDYGAAETLAGGFSGLTQQVERSFRNLWENKADEVWDDV